MANKKSRRYPLLLAAVIFILLVLAAMHLRQKRMDEMASIPAQDPAPWALHTEKLIKGRLSRGFPALASLEASREITISAQISGTILSMGPREGVSVSKGEQLASIDVRELLESRSDLHAQLEAARAEVERAKHEYQRYLQLKKKDAISAESVEDRKTRSITANNKVRSLQREIAAKDVHIGYGIILSPADARISARLAEPGDTAQPGKALYRLTLDSGARVKVKVPQTILEQIHCGTLIELQHGSDRMRVPVSRIFPSLDAQALGVAEADLDRIPFDLPSGARIPARLLLQEREDVLIIPQRALVSTNDQDGYVYALVSEGQEQRIRKVPLHIVLKAHEGIGIEADMEPGQPVVVAHKSVLLRLRDGDRVITADKTAP
ncbi:MAG: efflux RND transporter periplasmic adaptor subunit [gamma proteobacterium symbiont of Bathyaustriella thionipta]|nr:efflux RND transporter periplasmic adaptor subunit [gamma proteobacterium symbiont of Bathyaustriella thionipta]